MPGLLRPLMVPVMRLRAASESQAEVVVEVGERQEPDLSYPCQVTRLRRNSLRAAEEALAGGLSNIHMPPI